MRRKRRLCFTSTIRVSVASVVTEMKNLMWPACKIRETRTISQSCHGYLVEVVPFRTPQTFYSKMTTPEKSFLKQKHQALNSPASGMEFFQVDVLE